MSCEVGFLQRRMNKTNGTLLLCHNGFSLSSQVITGGEHSTDGWYFPTRVHFYHNRLIDWIILLY